MAKDEEIRYKNLASFTQAIGNDWMLLLYVKYSTSEWLQVFTLLGKIDIGYVPIRLFKRKCIAIFLLQSLELYLCKSSFKSKIKYNHVISLNIKK